MSSPVSDARVDLLAAPHPLGLTPDYAERMQALIGKAVSLTSEDVGDHPDPFFPFPTHLLADVYEIMNLVLGAGNVILDGGESYWSILPFCTGREGENWNGIATVTEASVLPLHRRDYSQHPPAQQRKRWEIHHELLEILAAQGLERAADVLDYYNRRPAETPFAPPYYNDYQHVILDELRPARERFPECLEEAVSATADLLSRSGASASLARSHVLTLVGGAYARWGATSIPDPVALTISPTDIRPMATAIVNNQDAAPFIPDVFLEAARTLVFAGEEAPVRRWAYALSSLIYSASGLGELGAGELSPAMSAAARLLVNLREEAKDTTILPSRPSLAPPGETAEAAGPDASPVALPGLPTIHGQPEALAELDRLSHELSLLSPQQRSAGAVLPHLLIVGASHLGQYRVAQHLAHILAPGEAEDPVIVDLFLQCADSPRDTFLHTKDAVAKAGKGVVYVTNLSRVLVHPNGRLALETLAKATSIPEYSPSVALCALPEEVAHLESMAPSFVSRLRRVVMRDLTTPDLVKIVTTRATELSLSLQFTSSALEAALYNLNRAHPYGRAENADRLLHAAVSAAALRMARDASAKHMLLTDADLTLLSSTKEKSTPAMDRLDDLVGITEVKTLVRSLVAEASLDAAREKAGLRLNAPSRHLIFAGRPGTAKTTVARLIASAYGEIGVLPHGHLVEVSRSDLVARYVGQTAPMVTEAFNRARGGVLFIDEAYSLVSGEKDDFGTEAVTTIVKLMEDRRADTIVIAAGYPDLMDEFLASNPGLSSRFSKTVSFPDYSTDELVSIFELLSAEQGYSLAPGVTDAVARAMTLLSKGKDFGNGRSVRGLLEQALSAMAARLVESEPSVEELVTILPEDIPFSTPRDTTPALDGLDSLIGLSEAKALVRTLVAEAEIDSLRQKAGLPLSSPSRHLIFAGQPGTAKTTVARLLASAYGEIGILPSGHVTEVSRAELVSSHVGGTARMVTDAFDKARGGVLFIDEAYSLISGGGGDFGTEAITQIVKLMEDRRSDTIVIAAGYPQLMEDFLAANPGLSSRFSKTVLFPDYSTEELVTIFASIATEQGYTLAPGVKEAVARAVSLLSKAKDFGNGRSVRALFEHSVSALAARLSGSEPSVEELSLLLPEDIPHSSPKDTTPAMDQLDALIGLAEVKTLVKALVAEAGLDSARQKAGLPTVSPSRHLIFSGRPGTAKTTVARLLASAYGEIGILPAAHVVEVSRAELVGSFVGQTAPLVTQAFDKAHGGVLFIDEAYSLVSSGGSDFGTEAITQIVKLMEDRRDDTIVIAAGYPELMEDFLAVNPGLSSRFSRTVLFPDYSTEELVVIFESIASSQGYVLAAGVTDVVAQALRLLAREKDFGNGRSVRGLLEKTISRMAARLMAEGTPTLEELSLILPADVPHEVEKKDTPALTRLDALIGLEDVKALVRSLIAEASLDTARKKAGLPTMSPSRHLIFSGRPGTAKTTVARLLASAYGEMGVLPSSTVVEVSRAELVGQYVGQTAPLVTEAFDKARGGVLFIDEAYSLVSGGGGDFGTEAITQIVKLMEDRREDTIVIAAGYADLMDDFLAANPGLSSRFSRNILFPDYSTPELVSIFRLLASDLGYVLAPGVEEAVAGVMEHLASQKDFGNGRSVRGLMEKAVAQMATRLFGEEASVEELSTLLPQDVYTTSPAREAGITMPAPSTPPTQSLSGGSQLSPFARIPDQVHVEPSPVTPSASSLGLGWLNPDAS